LKNYSEDLPLGDLAYLERVVKLCRESSGDAEKDIKLFFLMALTPYFDSIAYEGLDPRVANFLYRLSDFLSEERRRQIEIYPACAGENADVLIDGNPWYSLEEWRKMWEKKNAPYPIPHISFAKKLEKRDLLFLLPVYAKKD